MLNQARLDTGLHFMSDLLDGSTASRKPELCDIAKMAQQRLQSSVYAGIRSLVCDYHERLLVIRGQVSSYYQKQLAQEAVRHLCGVEAILNAVEVVETAEGRRTPRLTSNIRQA